MLEFHVHTTPCYRCHAVAWEHVDDTDGHRGRPQEVLACAFCGAMTRVAATTRRQPVRQAACHGEFRFQFGRFAGMTFAEAAAEPNGRRYLEHLRDTNEKLRDRIAEFLDTSGQVTA